MRAIKPLTATLLLMAWSSVSALADTLTSPTGEPILTVSGQISQTNSDDLAVFDLDMLRDLPVTQVETTTIWTEGTQVFEGVALQTLLETLGAGGLIIRASAINDYTVEIPMDSLTETAPLVAFSQNGEAMSRRRKGPLWIIYPYDSDAAFRSEVVYSRSIWQLDRLEVAD